MRFRATLLLKGKTATGFSVPTEIVTALGAGKHPAVRVTIGDYSYRSSIASMGGEFMLPVSAEHRAGAGLTAGDEAEVEVELDTAPREVTVPPDLVAALAQDEEARQVFEKLSYSHKLQHVLSIEQAKTAETRQRRIEKALSMLRTGRG